ncbi:MAG: TIR domain-containing protein [Lachnospiraceae bacterium]|nr:TIR domain-containing protein [Lachnospiraceae bacterium]
MQSEVETRKYCAFISYRHKELDKYVAKKLHTMIERYTVPGELRESWGSKKLGRVFRDEEELPVSSNLTDSICTALDNTDFLIVVCTPDTPESIWVEREIKYFLEHHDRSHVIAVLANGTPDTSFPKLITTTYDEEGNETGKVEPLAANLTGVDNKFRKSRMHKEAVRLYASIMGVPFDSLWQREKRHNLHCIIALVSVAAVVALGYCISIYMKNVKIEEQNEQITNQYQEILAQNKTIEDQNKEISEQNKEISEQNNEITAQYEDIKQKNKELKIKEAEALLGEGELLYEKGDLPKALECAEKSIVSDEGKEAYADDAEYLLTRSLGSLRYGSGFRTVNIIEQAETIEGLLLSEDETRLYTLDARGAVRCYDMADQKLIWTGFSKCTASYYTTEKQRMVEIKEYGLLLCLGEVEVTALSLEDGKEVWSQDLGSVVYTDFHVLSKDKKTLAVIGGSDPITDKYGVDKFIILNTEDGSVKKEIPLGDAFEGRQLIASGDRCGVFSDDGKKLAGMVYYSSGLLTADTSCIFEIDLETEEIKILRVVSDESAIKLRVFPFVIGMDYADDGVLTVVQYDNISSWIRTDEFDPDGKDLGGYHIDYVLPAREQYKAYQTNFLRYEDKLIFSCEAVIAEYSLTEKKFKRLNLDSGARVLNLNYINYETGQYAYITEDGSQAIYYGDYGISRAAFSDKNMIDCMAISKDYAVNEKGGYGVEVKNSSVLALVSAANKNTVYILRPDKDSGYSAVDWFSDDSAGSDKKNTYKLENVGNGQIAMWNGKSMDEVELILTDAKEGNVVSTYNIKTGEGDSLGAQSLIARATLWLDGKHFSYGAGTSYVGIYDLTTGTHKNVFASETVANSDLTVLSSGEVLHAAICYADDSSALEYKYVIRWNIGDGEIQEAEIPAGKKPTVKNGYLKKSWIYAGENGLIIVSLSDDEELISGYLVIDTADNSTKVIDAKQAEVQDDVMVAAGKSKKVFATLESDGNVRIVNAATGDTTAEIAAPTGAKEVSEIGLLNADTVLMVWTKSRGLYIYDIATGSLMFEGGFGHESSAASVELSVDIIEDPARHRTFFVTSRGAVILLNSDTWKKQADFFGYSAYCPETGELYRIKNEFLTNKEEKEEIIKIKVNTLQDYLQSFDR